MSSDALSLTLPAFEPLFRCPPRLDVESAWYGHVPFAQWVIGATKPRCLVELGTHNGVSYAAFCAAVRRGNLPTRCFAVDTWRGDEHAGFYDESVYKNFSRFHQEHYADFSELLRCTFDEALPYIPDGSVDLLHIDGRHHYEDVLHDFTSWRGKLSSRAVVLFHDTNVRERDFGVFRLWHELAKQFPHFEFFHSHGLGVLAYGGDVPAAIGALTSLGTEDVATVRERFTFMGERWVQNYALRDLTDRFDQVRAHDEAVEKELNRIHGLYAKAADSSLNARVRLSVARADLARAHQALAARADMPPPDPMPAKIDAARYAEANEAAALPYYHEACRLDQEIHNMRASRSWRITAPLRRLQAAMRGTAPAFAPPFTLPMPSTPPDEAAGATSAAPQAAPDRRHILFVSGESHTPGTIYRVDRLADLARRLGYRVSTTDIIPFDPALLTTVDAVILWRCPWSPHLQGIIDIARARGATLIFDVDDLMFCPNYARIDIIDGIRSQRFSESDTRGFFADIGKAMSLCDLVTCPTAELAQEASRRGMPALVVANGFADDTVAVSRQACALWRDTSDNYIRIGYAGGSRTHQRDFAQCAGAIAEILAANSQVRLVLFQDPSSGEGVVLINEFPELAPYEAQIEWRDMVRLPDLPAELARFAINIAPLELENPFCEAKSELKYFEAALVSVPTVASPTGPYRRAITDGVTGLLARTQDEWRDALQKLIDSPMLRQQLALNAYHDSLRRFGPEARTDQLAAALADLQDGHEAARQVAGGFAAQPIAQRGLPTVPLSKVLFSQDRGRDAPVTIIIPLYNYADYVVEALESALHQTVEQIDLVIIDDASQDDGVDVVRHWLNSFTDRFNRIKLLQHVNNSGLGFTRNSGFSAAETPFVLPLDADNRLRPAACAQLASALAASQAAYAYPQIQHFGDSTKIVGTEKYSARKLAVGNYIDAMALVRKSAWAEVGGYDHVPFGWEDYDLWCCLAERGRFGINVPEILADYRVHNRSMLRTMTDAHANRRKLEQDMRRRHPWLQIERA